MFVSLGSKTERVAQIQLADLAGRIVRRVSATGHTVEIDVRSLAQANYFIRILDTDQNVVSVFKFTRK